MESSGYLWTPKVCRHLKCWQGKVQALICREGSSNRLPLLASEVWQREEKNLLWSWKSCSSVNETKRRTGCDNTQRQRKRPNWESLNQRQREAKRKTGWLFHAEDTYPLMSQKLSSLIQGEKGCNPIKKCQWTLWDVFLSRRAEDCTKTLRSDLTLIWLPFLSPRKIHIP